MSFAAYKMMHLPTGIENSASGYLTHSRADYPLKIPPLQSDGFESEWNRSHDIGPIPNLIVSAGNVLDVYVIRVQEEDNQDSRVSIYTKRGGIMAGVCGVSLELVCHYKLHGNVESMAVLSTSSVDKKRDSIILTFQDAKISVLEFDDSIHDLRVRSMHCFEGPEWIHLKRGKESFARGPVIKVDPQGRCGGVLVYDLQMIILKSAMSGPNFDDGFGSNAAVSSRIEGSYIIHLRDLDMKHIKDFVFVHGYIEPVMVILHERELTWAGRVSWKHHTCALAALSISTSSKQHPQIWSAINLPHDVYKLLAVPSPIGGVVVIGANSIHYHSQLASCVLTLNQFAYSTQDFPRSSFFVELDCANATWLSDNVAMISSKTGELLLLTLVYDGRVVQRLDLVKSKASVITSGITALGSSLFFLASRLGDSLLVQFTRVMGMGLRGESEDIEIDDPSSKRARRSPSDVMQEEDLSLFASTSSSVDSSEKSFTFTVRDLLVNVGPLKDFVYGLRANMDPDAAGIAKQSNYELVCCSGHGKNGSICILQQSIRPELIAGDEIPGCKGIWTVYHKNARNHSTDSTKVGVEDEEYHAYLIISLENRTMVLETADDLREVTENVDYFVLGRTIAAGNLFGRRRVIQIFATGARILDGSFLTQEINIGVSPTEPSLNSGSFYVSSASIADPYVLLRMTDGSIQLLTGDPLSCSVYISSPSNKKDVSACTLYHDKGPDPWLHKARTDAWLSTGIGEALEGTDNGTQYQGDVYCALCYENGILEIFDVSNFSCVFSVNGFVSGRSHLVDSFSVQAGVRDQNTRFSYKGHDEDAKNIKVMEINMQRFSGQHSRPFLFGLLSDGTVLCYHAYLFDDTDNLCRRDDTALMQSVVEPSSSAASRLHNLRFIRTPLDNYSRVELSEGTSFPLIFVFRNVGGQEGLFLSGSRPAWMMLFRERLRIHPQLCDGPIVAFAVLHNVNCNHGFIYVSSKGLLKICQLPSGLSYDNFWPVVKVPLKATPYQVTYFAESNLYPVIVSYPVLKPLNQILSLLSDQESYSTETEAFNDDELRQTYTSDEFEVRILEPERSGGPWQTKARIPMQNSENALTIRVVTLLNESSKENETLLAVGTAYVQGEDVSARGRVLLFKFGTNTGNPNDVVSEVYSKELKGAISALASLQGHLLIASGPKIILHTWSGTELNGVAFFDAPPLYVVSLNIVKNFILLGDIHKSIYFLSRKEHGSQLSLLAKDFGSLDCLATEFLIDGSTLSLVVADQQKNIQIFYYAPKMTESWKGQKLLSRAEFHVGAHIVKFLRLQMLPTATGSEKTNRFALLFGTLDGGIGCIAPVDELNYRRLQSLQKKLVDTVPHVAGLNPRSFRQFRANGRAHRPIPDSMIDCELVSCYEMLPMEEQLDIAHQIGTTRSQILSNLGDLAVGTSFL